MLVLYHHFLRRCVFPLAVSEPTPYVTVTITTVVCRLAFGSISRPNVFDLCPFYIMLFQIRRRFGFQERRGSSLAEVLGKMRRSVDKRVRSPQALLNFALPITKVFNSYSMEKLMKDVVVGTTMATLMIPQVNSENAPPESSPAQ